MGAIISQTSNNVVGKNTTCAYCGRKKKKRGKQFFFFFNNLLQKKYNFYATYVIFVPSIFIVFKHTRPEPFRAGGPPPLVSGTRRILLKYYICVLTTVAVRYVFGVDVKRLSLLFFEKSRRYISQRISTKQRF